MAGKCRTYHRKSEHSCSTEYAAHTEEFYIDHAM